MKGKIDEIIDSLKSMDIDKRIESINYIKERLKEVNPFNYEPVECIKWVKQDLVKQNDYNPNVVAPPEMELLHTSIKEDGYTQPIVVWENNGIYEVVDGFHRNRVGKEYEDIKKRVKGYLPVVVINENRKDKGDRIASTIRHNRARGKHTIDGMSQIVVDLKRRNWTDKRISKELGLDQDEILRLSQVYGLAEMFQDEEFSEALEVNESDVIE